MSHIISKYGRHNYSEDTEGRKRAIEEAILEINLRDFITHNSNFKDSNSKFHNEEEFSAMMLWSISNKKTDNKIKNHPFSAERNYCSIIAQNFPKEKPFEILFNSDSKEYDEVAIIEEFYSDHVGVVVYGQYGSDTFNVPYEELNLEQLSQIFDLLLSGV